MGKFNALKDSSEAVFANTTATFTRLERMQGHYRVVTAPDAELTTNSFLNENSDIIPQLRMREDALEVLVKYVGVLDALATKDYEADVDKASIQLAGSLGKLATTSKALPDKQAEAGGIIATFIDVVGREIVREKRVNALKRVMDMSQKSIGDLANLIVGGNLRITEASDIWLGRIIDHANAIRPPFSTSSRLAFDERIAEQLQEARAVKESLASISAAVTRIPQAHQEIRDALEKKSSNLDSPKALVQQAQQADNFYRDLNQ